MPGKRVTLVVYSGDRRIWSGNPLTCRVIDLFASGGPRVLSPVSQIQPPAELDLQVPFDAGQAYGISIDAPDYRSGWRVLTHDSFVVATREIDHIIVRPMLVHKKAASTDLEAGFRRIEAEGSPFAGFGIDAFNQLANVQARFAFFNLEAKLRETWLEGRRLLSFVRGISAVAVDRVFLLVAPELRDLVAHSPAFRSAPGHGKPKAFPDLPAHPRSWKHAAFPYGNLQLSFSEQTVPHVRLAEPAEQCYSVDADIDLERDLGHAFEFVYNQVFDKKTDQTLVYRMLWDQNILPAYTLEQPVPELAGIAPVLVTMRAAARPRSAAAVKRAAKRPRRKPPSRRRKTSRIRRRR